MDVLNAKGVAVAKGIVSFDAVELPALLGKKTSEIAAELGQSFDREVIHRDDLVVLGA